VYTEVIDGNWWTRIDVHQDVTDDQLPLPSNVLFAVHIPGMRYFLLTNMKKEHEKFVLRVRTRAAIVVSDRQSIKEFQPGRMLSSSFHEIVRASSIEHRKNIWGATRKRNRTQGQVCRRTRKAFVI
jgi:hypothetical protein